MNEFSIKPERLIFDLHTYESCRKSVKRREKRAGIDKHISWNCARHFQCLLQRDKL